MCAVTSGNPHSGKPCTYCTVLYDQQRQLSVASLLHCYVLPLYLRLYIQPGKAGTIFGSGNMELVELVELVSFSFAELRGQN